MTPQWTDDLAKKDHGRITRNLSHTSATTPTLTPMNIAATHQALLGSAPPARLTIPELWQRARAFLAAMFACHGSPHACLQRGVASRERNAIIRQLKPAESLVRGLLIVGAITHLLMTEQGRRLRASAIPIVPPTPKAPPRPPPAMFHTGIDLTATLAKHWRPEPEPDPSQQTPETDRPSVDPDDPSTWRTTFRVLHWVDVASTRKPPPRRASPSRAPPSHLRLVRRIEALRRVLEDPRAHMRRLAAYMARLPRGCLGASPPTVRHRGKPLPDLRDDLFALFELSDPAIDAFNTS